MTSFSSPEEFLRALEENPAWKEAVRAIILGEELLRLPVEFRAFFGRVSAFIDQTEAFIGEQRQFNETFVRRLNRIEGDIGILRGSYARESLLRDAVGIANDLGFSFVRILPDEELARLAQRATGTAPNNELRSFRRADLIIEATDGSDIHYIAVETSYTADQRDTGRAQRNARYLTEITGQNAHPVIASVRNDDYVSGQIGSGTIYWHPLDDRGPVVPE